MRLVFLLTGGHSIPSRLDGFIYVKLYLCLFTFPRFFLFSPLPPFWTDPIANYPLSVWRKAGVSPTYILAIRWSGVISA